VASRTDNIHGGVVKKIVNANLSKCNNIIQINKINEQYVHMLTNDKCVHIYHSYGLVPAQ